MGGSVARADCFYQTWHGVRPLSWPSAKKQEFGFSVFRGMLLPLDYRRCACQSLFFDKHAVRVDFLAEQTDCFRFRFLGFRGPGNVNGKAGILLYLLQGNAGIVFSDIHSLGFWDDTVTANPMTGF